jgi:hypothetical protein
MSDGKEDNKSNLAGWAAVLTAVAALITAVGFPDFLPDLVERVFPDPPIPPSPPSTSPSPEPSPTSPVPPQPSPLPPPSSAAYLSDFPVRPETRAQVFTERDKPVKIAGEAFERGTIVRICPGLWAGTGAICSEPVEWDLAQKYIKLTGQLGPADTSENQGGRWIVTFYGMYSNNNSRELYRKTLEAGAFAEDIGSIDLTGVRRLQVLIEGAPSGSVVLANMRLDSASGTVP